MTRQDEWELVMRQAGKTRRSSVLYYAGLFTLLCSGTLALAQRPQPNVEMRANRPRQAAREALHPGEQHLPAWIAARQGLSPAQQEEALRHEPGFSRLTPEQQTRLIDRLHRLDMQKPEERQRLAEWNERFMALSPERQEEIRGASQALAQMPPERRLAMRQAFRDLRTMPPNERQEAINSARFQAEYTPQERTVLSNLLSIEPYERPAPMPPAPPEDLLPR